MVKQGTAALVAQLADEIIRRLDKSYDLVYVDYRDELSDSQVSALVRGDEWLEESWEWEADSRYGAARQIIDELAKDVVREWSEEADADLNFLLEALKDGVDEWDRVRFTIEERDTGSWVTQLIRQTPNVLLRINVLDEDHAYAFEDVSARRVLRDIGLRATRSNLESVRYVLANASPEYSVLLGYWIVGAAVADIHALPNDPEAEIDIVNPYLYLGNPFTGSGFISERPMDGVARVKRKDLRTDKDAFGYAVDEIYGGLRASDFECKLRLVGLPEADMPGA
jgi:hypothetical protein